LNKEQAIAKNFTSTQIKLFEETDQILDSESRYVNQYLRDVSFILHSVNFDGESELL
jgi:hypothetical protein